MYFVLLFVNFFQRAEAIDFLHLPSSSFSFFSFFGEVPERNPCFCRGLIISPVKRSVHRRDMYQCRRFQRPRGTG